MKPFYLTKLCCKKMNLFVHIMIKCGFFKCLNGLHFLAQRANLQLRSKDLFRSGPMIIRTLMFLRL
jgi:hypothetical protein